MEPQRIEVAAPPGTADATTRVVTVDVTESTARTHLHRIFEKTGTKRQAQLVRLVLATRFGVRRS